MDVDTKIIWCEALGKYSVSQYVQLGDGSEHVFLSNTAYSDMDALMTLDCMRQKVKEKFAEIGGGNNHG